MIIMAVDLGKARTGIAVSDAMESFAFPKEVITEYNTDRLVEKIVAAAKKYSAQLIVAGLPKNMDGTAGSRAEECTEIAEKIRTASKIETILWDERCTTVAAYTALDAAGTYGKKRKNTVDAVAATIILEGYLAFRKNKG
ncbi:MAG: Holliday junction resolvase RuvX [Ruminococcaceae bacterium]|nr:Holliday junction resolvase RuvX [Oscillospiraceae bacterium]